MIIWGSRGLNLKGASGQFFCPDCNDERNYQRHKVQRFFTLYFIPIIPMDVVHESVECLTCKQHFRLQALQYDPRAERAEISRELNQQFRTVISQFARMSGRTDEPFLHQISGAVTAFDGSALAIADARADMSNAERNYGVASRLLAQHLTERGREILVQNALTVATADGVLSDDKQAALTELATTLGMSEAHLRGVLAGWAPADPVGVA